MEEETAARYSGSHKRRRKRQLVSAQRSTQPPVPTLRTLLTPRKHPEDRPTPLPRTVGVNQAEGAVSVSGVRLTQLNPVAAQLLPVRICGMGEAC